MLNRRVQKIVLSLLPIMILALLTAPMGVVAKAQASTVTTVERISVSGSFTVPCIDEEVAFSGDVQIVTHVTVDATGRTHVRSIFTAQGVKGVGLTTGAIYQIIDPTMANFFFDGPPPFEIQFLHRHRFIGQGQAGNLLLTEMVHLTVNANGTVTADLNNFRLECR
jgi:hypothetical protein